MSKLARSYSFFCCPGGYNASKKVNDNCWQDAQIVFKEEKVAIPERRYDYLIRYSQCYPHLR